MSGLSVAIWLWQIMQVFTLGIPAIGPFSTVSWQSVHIACFSMCVLCGNGIGCSAFARTLKKSRLADASVLCAGVKTSSPAGGGAPQLDSTVGHTISARIPTRTRRSAHRTFIGLLGRSDAAQEIDDV